MKTQKIRLVGLFGLVMLFLIAIHHVSWSQHDDCPKEKGYYERPIGACQEMGGAFVCQQTCLSTFRKFFRATCDYSGTQTRTYQYPCRCCIKREMNFLLTQDYRGEYDRLPKEESIPAQLPTSELTETFFSSCPIT